MNADYNKYPKILRALNKTGTKFPDLLLADYARILQRIESSWGSKEAALYFDSLILEDRDNRSGFPAEVLNDVWLLKQIHESLFPWFSVSIYDPFNNIEVADTTGIQLFSSPADKTKSMDFNDVKAAMPIEPPKPVEPQKPTAPDAAPVTTPQPQNDASPPTEKKSTPWPNIKTLHELYEADEVRRKGGQVYATQGKRIGEILKSMGLIDDKILDAVEKRHHTKKAKDKPTGELLVYMGIIETEALMRALCVQAGVLMVDLPSLNIPYQILNLVPNEKAREKQAIPVGVYKGTLFLAVADPFNFADQHFFSFTTKLNVKPVFAPLPDIIERINTKWIETNQDIWAG